MPSFLPQIRKAVSQGFKDKLSKGTLRRYDYVLDERGDRQPIRYTDYQFDGIREDFDAAYRARAEIPEEDVRIMVILGSLSVMPERTDKVLILGSWHEVRQVMQVDPAQATAMLQAYVIDLPQG